MAALSDIASRHATDRAVHVKIETENRHSLARLKHATTVIWVATSISTDTLRGVVKSVIRAGTVATSRWRNGPDLVIIGVKRGGTTSLFRDLEQHPAMCPLVPSAKRLPLRENQKGVHYFDTGFERGDRWYRSHFPTTLSRSRHARATGASFTAEASPYYFFQPLAARRTALALPQAHFVLLLRDPVERTISHWAEQTRNGVEELSLSEAIAQEAERVGDAAAQLASGTIAVSHPHEQQTYAAQSEYADSLQRWIDLVGIERLTVAFSEDYYADPASVIKNITDQLGIDVMPPDVVGGHRNAAPRLGSIDASLEAELVERFRPDVENVAAILGTQPPWPRFFLQVPERLPDTSA